MVWSPVCNINICLIVGLYIYNVCAHLVPSRFPIQLLYTVCHVPLYIACVFMQIVSHKRTVWLSRLHVQVRTACWHLLGPSLSISDLLLFLSWAQNTSICAKKHRKIRRMGYWNLLDNVQFSRMTNEKGYGFFGSSLER